MVSALGEIVAYVVSTPVNASSTLLAATIVASSFPDYVGVEKAGITVCY